VLVAAVGLTTLQIRQKIREQIAGRDGEVLYAVALMHYAQDVEEGLVRPITDPGSQLSIVLKTSQLRGVLGIRLFDAKGNYVDGFPWDLAPGALAPASLPKLNQLRPVSHFFPKIQMSELFNAQATAGPEAPLPILEVDVPLHTQDGPLAGIAQ